LSVSMREQKRWSDHARFMDALAEEGFVVLGGPLGEGERRFLLIFNADSENGVETQLAEDPWSRMRLLQIDKIEPWEILLEKPSEHWAEIGNSSREIRKRTAIRLR
jgi:uncharacterized protein YciI